MLERIVQQMTQMLRNLSAILEKGAAHAEEAEDLSVEDLITRSLAPDMFNFIRQVQSSTDTAKFIVARLSGVEAPAWSDEESTVEELQARLEKAIAYLEDGVSMANFDGWRDRHVTMGFAPGMYILGADYLHEFALPNFYFHVTTAYDILRNAGVEIGKRDFIGRMSFKPLEFED